MNIRKELPGNVVLAIKEEFDDISYALDEGCCAYGAQQEQKPIIVYMVEEA